MKPVNGALSTEKYEIFSCLPHPLRSSHAGYCIKLRFLSLCPHALRSIPAFTTNYSHVLYSATYVLVICIHVFRSCCRWSKTTSGMFRVRYLHSGFKKTKCLKSLEASYEFSRHNHSIIRTAAAVFSTCGFLPNVQAHRYVRGVSFLRMEAYAEKHFICEDLLCVVGGEGQRTRPRIQQERRATDFWKPWAKR